MKFPQLPLGSRFELEGRTYLKTGPLVAQEEGGPSRMIPRYALVRPLDGGPPPAPPRQERHLPEGLVRAAFAAYGARCGAVLEGLAAGLPEATREAALAAAREALGEAERAAVRALEGERRGKSAESAEE